MSQNIEINAIRSRPRFKVCTKMSREEFTEKLDCHFRAHCKVLGGYVTKDFSVIRLRQDKEKYWAPQLQIRTELDEDDPEILNIRGLFGPRPAVWTFFLFLYALGGTIVFILGMYGCVQLLLKQPAPWLWSIPLGFGIIGGTYFAAKIGQNIAKSHMNVLRTFVETVLVSENIIKDESYTEKSA